MGYRNYIGKMSKEVYLENKGLNQKELCEKFPEDGDVDEYRGETTYYFSGRDLPTYKELHELGKYCEFDIDDTKETFFTTWEDDDCEFSVGTKETILGIIEDYRNSVLSWYKSQLDEPNEKLLENCKQMVSEWGGDNWDRRPYNLDVNRENLVNSWKYEYAIFDLVRIYKNFDWENEVLIYSGW